MKKAIFGLAILVSVLASCSKNETSESGFSRISASSGSFTKAHLDFVEQKQVWDGGDKITVHTAKVPEGRIFTLASQAGLSTADFVSDVPVNDTNCYYAVYPASAAGKASFSEGGDALEVNYPSSASFDYVELCGNVCNYMAAESDGTFFQFKNIFSYIELAVTGPAGDAVRTIVVEGLNDELLSGSASVRFSGGEPVVEFKTGGKSITVDFGTDGMEMSGEVFDITVPPVLSQGFKVTVNTVKGLSRTFKSGPNPEFVANKIISMPGITVE